MPDNIVLVQSPDISDARKLELINGSLWRGDPAKIMSVLERRFFMMYKEKKNRSKNFLRNKFLVSSQRSLHMLFRLLTCIHVLRTRIMHACAAVLTLDFLLCLSHRSDSVTGARRSSARARS